MCLIYTAVTYNKLVDLKARVKNSWSQIDVQLKKRYDLIPNLVETVKGYATHEKETFTEVAKARASVGGANTTQEKIEANNQLTSALSRLLIVAEKYPELQANSNFTDLQNQLKDLENKIAYSRQFYNDTVMKYNKKIAMFPSNIVASLFKFKEEAYFSVTEAQREAPVVKF